MAVLPVQAVFKTLHEAGLTLVLKPNGKIGVSPSKRLTDDLRALIRVHRELVVDWLQAANDPVPEPPLDPADWRELAAAYHTHHLKCRDCIAAGRGAVYGLRCGIGAALWNAYQEAP